MNRLEGLLKLLNFLARRAEPRVSPRVSRSLKSVNRSFVIPPYRYSNREDVCRLASVATRDMDDTPGPIHRSASSRFQSVFVFDPYGFTATTASVSVEGRCREITVTHSPGFTAFIAARLLSGTFTRIAMY
jgi:hypothetical protein